MTQQFYVNRNQKSAPIIAFAGVLLYAIGEWIDYRAAEPSYVLQLAGFILAYWAFFWLWQNANKAGLEAIDTGEIAKTAGVAIVLGAFAMLVAATNKEFALLIAQVLAMLTLAHVAVTATYVIAVGNKRHWWVDERGYLRWGFQLGVIIQWLAVAALGSFFSDSPVWLFQSVGTLLMFLRWWALALVPLSFIVRAVNHRAMYNKYKGGK